MYIGNAHHFIQRAQKQKPRDDYTIRHRDELKLVVTIKQKIREMVNYFKQLPKAKKIILILSQILKLVSVGIIIYDKIVSAKKVSGLNNLEKENKTLKFSIDWRREEINKLKEIQNGLSEKIFELKKYTEMVGDDKFRNVYAPTAKEKISYYKTLRNLNKGLAKFQKEYSTNQNLYKRYQKELNKKENSQKINEEKIQNIKSIETRMKIRTIISLVSAFIGLIGDFIAFSGNKISAVTRDCAIKRMIDRKIRRAILDEGKKGYLKKGGYHEEKTTKTLH